MWLPLDLPDASPDPGGGQKKPNKHVSCLPTSRVVARAEVQARAVHSSNPPLPPSPPLLPSPPQTYPHALGLFFLLCMSSHSQMSSSAVDTVMRPGFHLRLGPDEGARGLARFVSRRCPPASLTTCHDPSTPVADPLVGSSGSLPGAATSCARRSSRLCSCSCPQAALGKDVTRRRWTSLTAACDGSRRWAMDSAKVRVSKLSVFF